MRRGRAGAELAALLAGAGLVASGCTGGTAASGPTTPLPPLPPAVVAYVTVVGTGANLGLGDTVVPVDVTAGSGSGPGLAIRVGAFPDAIAITPDGTHAYVTSYSAGTLTPIDLVSGKVGPPIRVGTGPAGIAIAPDGRTAYVTDAGSAPIGHTVTPINLATGQPLAPIDVGAGPQGIAITPDGRTAYVADAGAIVAGQTGAVGDTVTPVDLSTSSPLAPIRVGNAPTAVAVSPDGRTVEVANASSDSVSSISVATGVAGAPISLNGSPQALAFAPEDSAKVYVAVAPSGIGKGDDVTPITVSTSSAVATGSASSAGSAGSPIPVCKSPEGIAVTGTTAWVTCLGSGALLPLDLVTGKAGAPDAVPGGPYALALDVEPQGSYGAHRARPNR